MAFLPIDEVAGTLSQLRQLLGNTFDRSIAAGVVNNTDYTLNLTQSDGNSNFESGGYQAGNLPGSSLPPQQAEVFGMTNTAPATGVVGVIHYTVADSDGNDGGVMIHLTFSNPFIGSNHYEQSVDVIGDPCADFSVEIIGSVGNNAQVQYVITATPL
ncbi:hypothetical protein [Ktedonobacter robiniae]|uniref:Uncharacterized protein n=1 Tax=Ktedonobacter robiniae TaxID=2778365 RepID=A0ABQ3V5E2_9CHLR|nr:hypothetical protein [Ktedonobacter robiniae]GHO60416.1 hypothetical protein KSB_88910 [Ktedonobacter robiniae]